MIIDSGNSSLFLAASLAEHPEVHIFILNAGTNHLSELRIQDPARPSPLACSVTRALREHPKEAIETRAYNPADDLRMSEDSGQI